MFAFESAKERHSLFQIVCKEKARTRGSVAFGLRREHTQQPVTGKLS